MAEAEDVLVDAARHATVYAQDLWRRHRPAAAGPQPLRLPDVARRIDLLLCAAFGRSFALRVAQAAVPPNWLARWMQRDLLPAQPAPVPVTDGETLWLPPDFGAGCAHPLALARLRLLALRLAMRAVRGSPALAPGARSPLLHDLFLLGEAQAADAALALHLPGLAAPLAALRAQALQRRPRLGSFPPVLRVFEQLVRDALAASERSTGGSAPLTPGQVLAQATERAVQLPLPPQLRHRATALLWRDEWTGDFLPPRPPRRLAAAQAGEDESQAGGPPRSARLRRRPDVREAEEEEDDRGPGAWMVQSAQPNEAAEDPLGMQRPTDRDETTASEEFADALSELPEARLVATPGKPKEVLLTDDPPPARSKREADAGADDGTRLCYPEWDWRAGAYRDPGATVLLQPALPGPLQWVEQTLAERATMLQEIRRRFELLRAQRVRLRRQLDGDTVDIDAWTAAQADFRAGLPLDQRLYQTERRARRDMAITLLVDVSGSTDGWIAADRRVIDVAREALLLVCIALEGMAEPYSVLAFSGEGPQAVVVRPVKAFAERYGPEVAQRIAGLEPEHYTRAGAAIRHATAMLMRQPATHRLLLLLSDGKPNDVDDYEGRYGVEDMRQAVTEARLQGISPFCLTIDRQGASYLPAVFGAHHYALLPQPALLPSVLLDWLRRLVSA